MTIAAVAICYNEEQDLPGFFDCLLPWVDEIVLVDDGSSDRTQELAEAAGEKVKFIQSRRDEGQYFSHQRNKGIEAAESDWLLHMDIDERVSPELAKEIIEATKTPDRDAFKFKRLNYFLHRPMRGGGWQNWNQVHLAKKHVLKFEGMFHEKCILSVEDNRVGQLTNLMHHLNDSSYGERLRKSQVYTEEIAHEILSRRKNISAFTVVYLALKEFLVRYFIRLGIRDGGLGLLSALHSASAVFRGGFLAWDERNNVSREELESQLHQEWMQSEQVFNSEQNSQEQNDENSKD